MIEVTLNVDNISKRDHYIGESQGTSIEGGALNANYREVDAVARVANYMGTIGYKYEKDWYWEGHGCDEIIIKVKDKRIASQLKLRW